MPFDSEGVFSRIHNWEDDRINDIDIASDRHDEEDDNFASGLSQCLLKSGIVPMQGNMNMGGFALKNMANGTTLTDAVNLRQLNNAIANNYDNIKDIINLLSPVGDIKASLQTSNHGNWLMCNGQAVSRTEYADLFALIGENFGVGNGVTTFNVPDYRGKFLRGLGGDSAENMYTTQAEGVPNITQSDVSLFTSKINDGFLTNTTRTTFPYSGGGGTPGLGITDFTVDASKGNAIYGASNHVTPINQAVNYFIRAKKEV